MDQIKYIYENINVVENHSPIIHILDLNECKYTKNNNGIYVNLKTLDKEVINKIYHHIQHCFNHCIDYENDIEITEVNLPNDTQIRGVQNDLENIHFNQLHKDIIHFSKYTYKI